MEPPCVSKGATIEVREDEGGEVHARHEQALVGRYAQMQPLSEALLQPTVGACCMVGGRPDMDGWMPHAPPLYRTSALRIPGGTSEGWNAVPMTLAVHLRQPVMTQSRHTAMYALCSSIVSPLRSLLLKHLAWG